MHKCYICENKFKEAIDVHKHILGNHNDMIPKDHTVERFYYMQKTGREHGSCVVCKRDTGWNGSTMKYHRFCKDPRCKEKYREVFKQRMIKKHGKVTLLNDPKHQRKMLANRSISGEYTWSDGKKVPYTGSYEKDFLEFLDKFLEFPSEDIIAPSPHTYSYRYGKEDKFYIPDFFIPSLNLEVEIKDGGDNPNNHHKIQRVDKVKEVKKDEVMRTQKNFSYIKVTNKEYRIFVDLLMDMKESMGEDGEPKHFFYGENPNNTSVQKIVKESTDVDDIDVMNMVRSSINDDTKEVLEYTLSHIVTNPPEQDIVRITDYMAARAKYHEIIDTFEKVEPTIKELNVTKDFVTDISDVTLENFTREVLYSNDLDTNSLMTSMINETSTVMASEYLNFTKAIMLLENIRTERIKTSSGTKHPVYVMLTHTGTTLSRVIKGVSRRPFSHSSISFDSTLENMYSFGRVKDKSVFSGSFVKEDINKGIFKEKKTDISYALYATFVTVEQLDLMIERLETFIKKSSKLKYDVIGLVYHALGMESSRGDSYFCSQFVDMVLHSGKTYFDKHSSLIHPSDYMDHTDFMLVSEGRLSEYDSEAVDKRVKDLAYLPKETKSIMFLPQALFIPVVDTLRNKSVELKNGMKVPYTYSAFVKKYPGSKYFFIPLNNIKNFSEYTIDSVSETISIAVDKINLRVTNVNQ